MKGATIGQVQSLKQSTINEVTSLKESAIKDITDTRDNSVAPWKRAARKSWMPSPSRGRT